MVYVDFENRLVGNDANILEVIFEQSDFLDVCTDGWRDTETYNNTDFQAFLEENEDITFDDLPDEWKNEIESELFSDFLEERFESFEENQYGELVPAWQVRWDRRSKK